MGCPVIKIEYNNIAKNYQVYNENLAIFFNMFPVAYYLELAPGEVQDCYNPKVNYLATSMQFGHYSAT